MWKSSRPPSSYTMLALPPHLFSSAPAGWQLEENIIHEPYHDDYLLASCTTPNSFASSDRQLPEFDCDIRSTSMKKLNHNAYERDRRKKMNELYSSLRDLLPERDHSKKLSIPCTVGRVLKYIPELQRQVERLMRKKEEILLRMSRDGEIASSFIDNRKGNNYPIFSAACLNERELMIQTCNFNKTVWVAVSSVVRILEGEGLELVNATTLTTHDDRTFYSLHLKTKEATSVEPEVLCEHVIGVLREQARLGLVSYCMQM